MLGTEVLVFRGTWQRKQTKFNRLYLVNDRLNHFMIQAFINSNKRVQQFYLFLGKESMYFFYCRRIKVISLLQFDAFVQPNMTKTDYFAELLCKMCESYFETQSLNT